MSAWKSRWSCERLVKAPTAKRVPATRPSASAWLDTSIATSVTPSSSITANSACRSGASGVVNALGRAAPAMRVPTVPTSPVVRPAAARPGLEQVRDGGLAAGPGDAEDPQALPWGRRRRSRRRCRAPPAAAGAPARALRAARARSRPVGSVRTATAPAERACPTKSAPWARAPGRAAKRSPGRTSAARNVTPVTNPPGSPASAAATRAPSMAAARTCRSTRREARGRGGRAAAATAEVRTGGTPEGYRRP